MNPVENASAFVPSAAKYIFENFAPTNRIAMLVLKRDFGEIIPRITSAKKVAHPQVSKLAALQERETAHS